VKIAAVIPVYNRSALHSQLLARLLETIRRQTFAFDEVILVDNASPISPEPEGCRVIPMGRNAGFAAAVNTGWRASDAEWIAILNSDVELDPVWAERLLAGASSVGFATGLILNATDRNRVDGTYDLMSRAGCAWRAGYGESPVGYSATAIALAPGTACIFRRDVLVRMNGYDETFGSYLEDVDLGLRCLRAGVTGLFIPEAVAWHHGSATLGRWNPEVVRLISRNQVKLIARHYDRAFFRRNLRAILTGQFLWGVVALRHGAPLAWVRGKIEGMQDFRLTAEPSADLDRFLADSEREIRRRASDPYWRWYFRLAGTTTEAP
jgi:GT2 family glycosyltransferase